MNPYKDLMLKDIEYEEVVESIKKEEGFSGMPYKDIYGNLTIGYGIKLPLTQEEAELLLRHRLSKIAKELSDKEPFFLSLPPQIKQVILNMAYQMGVVGVLRFKKMWAALKEGNYKKAADEMLDSKWAVQTPNRAKKLADIVYNIADNNTEYT